jgi:uncharacterized OsmC-like protein
VKRVDEFSGNGLTKTRHSRLFAGNLIGAAQSVALVQQRFKQLAHCWHPSRNTVTCPRRKPARSTNKENRKTKGEPTMKTTTTASRDTMLNGVNVTKLAATIKAIGQQPELAQFQFRARNQWIEGGHNQASINEYYGTCQQMERHQPFVFDADEPPVLLGKDQGANPVEFVLAGLSGCMTTTLAYHAAARGLKIDSIRSEFEGDLDLQGMLDLDPNVRSGYREIRVKFKVKGDLDASTVQELVRKSPVFDIVSNPVTVKITVEKE